jgi:hypothetical protein
MIGVIAVRLNLNNSIRFMFFQSNKAIAIEVPPSSSVSANQISVPLDWVLGSVLGIFALFFSVVWWVRGLSAKVDSNTKLLEELEAQLETEHRKEMKEEIRLAFKAEITQSASDICHSFELFAMEMRTELRNLSEGLEAKNAEVKRIAKRVDRLNVEVGDLLSETGLHARQFPLVDDDGD